MFFVRFLCLVLALAVAVEGANFALFLQGMKAIGRPGIDYATVETRLWISVAAACIAWIIAVKLGARLLLDIRDWRAGTSVEQDH